MFCCVNIPPGPDIVVSGYHVVLVAAFFFYMYVCNMIPRISELYDHFHLQLVRLAPSNLNEP